MSRKVGLVLAESLKAHGLDRIFCVPGESYIGFTNVLGDFEGLDLKVCRHEAGAAFMATADGQVTGYCGCCIVSRGPGLCNATIAMHSALHDAKPLVVLVGQVERKDIGRMALQEQNYSVLLADVTKKVIELVMPEQASEVIARAFHLATTGTPGPVAVVLPEDIFDELTDVEIDLPRPRVISSPGKDAVQQLADMLKKAERPLIWVGGAMPHNKETGDKLKKLAEKWQLPMSPTQRRPHLFDFTHPNFGGYMGIRPPKEYSDMMKKSDLLVSLGERLTDTTSQAYTFPKAPQPQLPLVHIWPDANEIGRVWRPDLGIAADPEAMVSALLEMDAPMHSNARQAWISSLNELYCKFMKHEWEPTPDGVNFAAIVCGVDKYLAPDAAISSDAGNFGSYIHRYTTFRSTHTFLSSILGAMGSGVPMGVAAAMRDPQRQVVIFVGDGGILMTGNELATARLYGVNPIIILSDNDNYSTINMHHHVRYPGHVDEKATILKNPDFVKWAEAFGAKAFLIKEEAEIDPVFKQAFAVKGQPVLVHVRSSSIQMSAWRRKPAA